MTKIVEVEWLDAHATTGSTTLRKAAKIKAMRTITIGFLMSENDDGLVIATDIYPNSPKEGAGISFIPHGMIVNYYEWR